jgi:hypothetical protein
MKRSVEAITLASALLWGGCMLFVGLVNLGDPSYGGEFLRMMNSVYPGADSVRTIGSVLLGALYGFGDGAIAGFLFASLYRFFAGVEQKATNH